MGNDVAEEEGMVRLERGGSLRRKVGRSNNSLADSELSSKITAYYSYERLSESMRLTRGGGRGKHSKIRTWTGRKTPWASFIKLFSFNKSNRDVVEVEAAAAAAAKQPAMRAGEELKSKRRSSWLPDPDRRWPVQGW